MTSHTVRSSEQKQDKCSCQTLQFLGVTHVWVFPIGETPSLHAHCIPLGKAFRLVYHLWDAAAALLSHSGGKKQLKEDVQTQRMHV